MAEPADTLEGTSLHQLLSNDENSLLDVIDELRSQGIGDLLGEKGLPQIIVCGDQSSGKSSVLEALTRVRFPTKSNVCTTFPTELRLRREPATRISCCIKPAMSRTAEERERLARFQGSFDSPEKFPELITSARECMTGPDSGTGNTFFEDVLEVEIVGPKLAPLTIVDLPGLIHFSKSSSGDQDISFVSSLVERYMRQENSIILAVVSAHNDINNQTVLSRIEKIESGGNRTLGIITKPDELPPGSEKEQEFLDYARNNEMKFRYGWHVVRNRKYEERDHSFEERDATEKEYFRSSRWQALPRRQVGLGVESLREKLSRMLLAHITLSLPSVLVKISADLYQSENELNKLGESRSTPKEQQNYLCDIGDNFREYTKDALEGRYRRKSFFGNPSEHGALEKRLRAYIRKLNDEFANDMLHHGHKWDIVDDTEPGGRISARPKSNLAASRTPEIIGKSDFLNHVDSLAVLERGNELPGTSNPLLVGSLFRQQSEAWGDIAEEHLNRVWSAVKAFMETLLAHMTDERTCNQLLIHVVDPAMEARQQLLGRKLKELLVPYLDHEPIMIDPRFSDKKWSSRTRRIASLIIETMQDDEENGIVTDLSLDEVEAKVIAATTADNHYGSVGALETMEAYYDTTIMVFVSNVASLAVEQCLLADLANVFSPATIRDMSPDKIALIASESNETLQERGRLKDRVEVLRKGLHTLRRIHPDARINQNASAAKLHTQAAATVDPTINGQDFASSSRKPDLAQAASTTPIKFSNFYPHPPPMAAPLFGGGQDLAQHSTAPSPSGFAASTTPGPFGATSAPSGKKPASGSSSGSSVLAASATSVLFGATSAASGKKPASGGSPGSSIFTASTTPGVFGATSAPSGKKPASGGSPGFSSFSFGSKPQNSAGMSDWPGTFGSSNGQRTDQSRNGIPNQHYK